MSVEQQSPYRMPQPEQWCADHHMGAIFTGLVFVAGFAAVVYALAYLIWMAV